MKVLNHIELWDTEFAWCSQSAIHQVCLYGLEHNLGIHDFRPTWPCQIVKVLATWVKFLESSSYCTVINCAFIFHTTNIFGSFYSIIWSVWICKTLSSQMGLHCMFICAIWSKAKLVTNHQLRWDNQLQQVLFTARSTLVVIYMIQTSTYQNTAKLLTHPSV